MAKNKKNVAANPFKGLFLDISRLIEDSRKQVALSVNSKITLLYWNIGKMIRAQILQSQRAEYGEQIIASLSKKLTERYGKGWSKQQLWNCLRTAERITSQKKILVLSKELSWTHIKTLIAIKEDIKMDFYIALCGNEKWNTRTLEERIDSMLYERTALSKKPEKLLKKEIAVLRSKGTVTPDLVFRDPYFLNFLGLKDIYSEKDIESAILNQLQEFIVEMGTDFALLARQKRILIDGEDFKIDLLFYHRGLKRLVVIDLKLERFKPAHKGQMELYLKWLDRYERKNGEESPIGLILCAGKKQEQIELLELNKGQIRVAEYMTQLPPKKVLFQKLNKAIELAKKATPSSPPQTPRSSSPHPTHIE
ncbi:MAG TPA: PDDEXK nuclease domain-containing protein [Puia sp.]|nr:PDDEXK nuclease domain-containing protein [Puia sp.]